VDIVDDILAVESERSDKAVEQHNIRFRKFLLPHF